MNRKNALIRDAKAYLTNPEKLDHYVRLLSEEGYLIDAKLLQTESAKVRNKPLYEIKHLLELTAIMPLSKDTLFMYRRLALLFEIVNEPRLAIELYKQMLPFSRGCEKEISRIEIHPLLNLTPSITVRSDISSPILFDQELEKNAILDRAFKWRIIVPSAERRLFKIKFLDSLDLWESSIKQSINRNVEIEKEKVVYFDGKNINDIIWLRISRMGIRMPSPYVYYALELKKDDGYLLGEGYGVFNPMNKGSEDLKDVDSNSLFEAYHSLYSRKNTGEWLTRVHAAMIKHDELMGYRKA